MHVVYQSFIGEHTVDALGLSLAMLLAATIIVALDQASKALAISTVRERSGFPVWSGPRVRIVTNANIGFGLVHRPSVLVAMWSLAVLGIVILVGWYTPLQGQLAPVALGAAIGGATGNLLDILRRGSVVDFIDIRIWPVFNLADTAIVTGVLAALGTVILAA